MCGHKLFGRKRTSHSSGSGAQTRSCSADHCGESESHKSDVTSVVAFFRRRRKNRFFSVLLFHDVISQLPIVSMNAQIRRRDRDSDVETRKWPKDNSELYFVDGLWPSTRYSFRFAAENAVGIGDWSQEKEIWTHRESRPEKPELRNLHKDSNGEVVSPFAGLCV